VRVTTPGCEHPDFRNTGLDRSVPMPIDPSIHKFPGKLRANQWSYADYDGDGAADLIVGTDDWSEYGWDNAYDEKGNWTNGPLRDAFTSFETKATTSSPNTQRRRKSSRR